MFSKFAKNLPITFKKNNLKNFTYIPQKKIPNQINYYSSIKPMNLKKKINLIKLQKNYFCMNIDPNDPNRKYKPPKPETPLEDMEEEDSSYYEKSHTTLYAFTLTGSFLIFLYALQQMDKIKKKSEKKKVQFSQKHYGKPLIGGSWNLKDIEDKNFGSDELKGKYYIIYFGFCKCPDICPQSMNKLAKAYELVKKSSESQYFDLKLVFVSVDPDRDSNEKIKKFLSFFKGDFIGVTGKSNNDPDLKDMLKKFKIYATKIEFDLEEDDKVEKNYTLDHTVISYLMSDKNEYLDHLGSSLNAKDMAKKVIESIMDNENNAIYN